MVHPKEAGSSASAFQENDIGSKEKTRFLGEIKTRYVGSLVDGALHAIASIIVMLLVNVFFISQVVFGFHFSRNVMLKPRPLYSRHFRKYLKRQRLTSRWNATNQTITSHN
jgi:hypothetical protein